MYWQRTVTRAINLKWHIVSWILFVTSGIVLGVGANSSNTLAMVIGFAILIIAIIISIKIINTMTNTFEKMVHEFEETIEALKKDNQAIEE